MNRKGSLAVDRMTTNALVRRLRGELQTVANQYCPGRALTPAQGALLRAITIARELELRGTQLPLVDLSSGEPTAL